MSILSMQAAVSLKCALNSNFLVLLQVNEIFLTQEIKRTLPEFKLKGTDPGCLASLQAGYGDRRSTRGRSQCNGQRVKLLQDPLIGELVLVSLSRSASE